MPPEEASRKKLACPLHAPSQSVSLLRVETDWAVTPYLWQEVHLVGAVPSILQPKSKIPSVWVLGRAQS